jgi:hypothetical protein
MSSYINTRNDDDGEFARLHDGANDGAGGGWDYLCADVNSHMTYVTNQYNDAASSLSIWASGSHCVNGNDVPN